MPNTTRRADGFSLVETLVAMTILVVGVSALASLVSVATRANATSRTSTVASLLAAQKMEQLLALTWSFDALERPVSDAVLSPAPPDTLRQNTGGYCDFFDAAGAPLPGGTEAAARGGFVRRWSIQPLASNPANARALQVVVLRSSRTAAAELRLRPDEASLATVRTRTGT